jgi:hypothetical protein
LIFKDGKKYAGNFINHKIEGKGEINLIDGSFYKGNFKNGKFHGLGVLFS